VIINKKINSVSNRYSRLQPPAEKVENLKTVHKNALISMRGEPSEEDEALLVSHGAKRIEPASLIAAEVEERVQPDQVSQFTQRMLLDNPLLQRHLAEQSVLNPLFSTHTC
jgi:hypothetical protein